MNIHTWRRWEIYSPVRLLPKLQLLRWSNRTKNLVAARNILDFVTYPVWILQAWVLLFLIFSRRASSPSSFIDRWNSFHMWFKLLWLYPIPSHCIFFKIIRSRAWFGRWRRHNIALFKSTQEAEHSWVIEPSTDRFVNIQTSSKMADF